MNVREFPAQNHPLWVRLQSFDFDESCALPFSARLARENGWSRAFAARVVEEYRKFLFLACESGHAVTPSEEIDQAWHLHLVYSRSYWEELCPHVLQKPLHHGPTRGGRAEGAKFENWYARTLESYEKWFGQAPPPEIWPDAKRRFDEAAHFRRVNTRRCWIVPKISLAQGVGALAALLFLGGCGVVWSEPTTPNPLDWGGGPFLALFWILCVVLLPFSLVLRSAEIEPRDRNFPPEIEPYEVARLQNKGAFALEVALTRMLQADAIEIDRKGMVRRKNNFAGEFAFERAVWEALPFAKPFAALAQATMPALQKLDENLRAQGLLSDSRAVWQAQKIPLGATAFLLVFGTAKMALGIARDRPVGFLFLSLLLVAIFGIYVLMSAPRVSSRGQSYLQHLRRDGWNLGADNANWVILALVFGGAAMIPAEIRAVSRPASSSDSVGSGCDGGGSSSGCGGGGCGGCGGGS